MVSVCTGLLGEEGRVSTSVDTRLTINRIPLYIYTHIYIYIYIHIYLKANLFQKGRDGATRTVS